MPHKHSQEAKYGRTQRALRLGFVKPSTLIEVSPCIASDAKVVTKALEAHKSVDEAIAAADPCARAHHSLRLAAVDAHRRGIISPQDLGELSSLNRAAGRAKHGISRREAWADFSEDGGLGHFSPPCGVEARKEKASVEEFDPWSIRDPWPDSFRLAVRPLASSAHRHRPIYTLMLMLLLFLLVAAPALAMCKQWRCSSGRTW